LLPSTLYARFKDNSEDESLDHENLFLHILTVLSNFGDISSCFGSRIPPCCNDLGNYQDPDIVTWISNGVAQKSATKNDFPAEKWNGSSFLNEWYMGLRYIHELLDYINPFELHCLASQSILLSEDPTIPHQILCLLLCSHALHQCPLSLQKRWKRWQSLVCETLRIFQDSIHLLDGNGMDIDSEVSSFSLFNYHIVPSCLHAINQLPLRYSYHVAIFSALLGTGSNLLGIAVVRFEAELSRDKKDTAGVSAQFSDLLSSTHNTIQSVITYFDRFSSLPENSAWIETIRRPKNMELNRNEEVDFWIYRNSLSWWAHHRCSYDQEERIANMDTSVHEKGLGLLAMKAFQERPMVYHPNYAWTIWFPHVVEVFNNSTGFPCLLQESSYRFLESLLEFIPENSLVQETAIFEKSEKHLELFHSLSNQLITRMETTSYTDEGKIHEEAKEPVLKEEDQFKMLSQHTVRLIKTLLTRFTTASQVKIVEKLMKNSSMPGFQARFLDLLRPLVSVHDIETKKLLWMFLMSILDDLFKKYWNRKDETLVDVDVLINRDVEIAIGAITMIQMWSLAKQEATLSGQKELADKLRSFHTALQTLLTDWSEDASLAPNFHYRLFLLDSALQNAYNSLKNGITS